MNRKRTKIINKIVKNEILKNNFSMENLYYVNGQEIDLNILRSDNFNKNKLLEQENKKNKRIPLFITPGFKIVEKIEEIDGKEQKKYFKESFNLTLQKECFKSCKNKIKKLFKLDDFKNKNIEEIEKKINKLKGKNEKKIELENKKNEDRKIQQENDKKEKNIILNAKEMHNLFIKQLVNEVSLKINDKLDKQQ